MSSLPILTAHRLTLRPFGDADAVGVRLLAGDARVADTTLLIPHPYPEGAAEAWIATHEAAWEMGGGLTLAIDAAGIGLIGAIGLGIERVRRTAELGYWIGTPYWNRGFCTEAARAIVRFGFERLELERITARHLSRNPASGRVLEKVGLRFLSEERRAVWKAGRHEDARSLAISRAEWVEQTR